MIISFNWLTEYVPQHGLTPEQMAHTLTFRAVNVEALEKLPDGDARLSLEVTFNRPDLLGHVGVAREIACATGAPLVLPDPRPPVDERCPVSSCAAVAVETPELCPRFVAHVIRGVTVKESPPWLKARLIAIGLRPVNNVVDVTNYVLYEMGKPLHAFDLATLAEQRLVVRRARAKEEIEAIDGTRFELTPETVVVADARRAVAIAGIMGGRDTEITERSRDVLLESAHWDPVTIRRTVRRLGLRSDSSHRFERGVDPASVELANRRAAALILEVAGGSLCAGAIDVDAKTLPGPRKVGMRLSRLRALGGVEISRKRAAHLLTGLGMDVVETDETLEVVVPTARAEVEREVDLIEEVVRTHGYEHVPLNPGFPVRVSPKGPREEATLRVKRLLAGAGFREVLTLSFIEKDDAIDPPIFTSAPPLTVKNPVDPAIPALRRSLMGSILQAKRINFERGNRRAKLFEIALAYLPNPGSQPGERLQLALVADQGFHEMKGVLEALARDLGVSSSVAFGAAAHDCLHPDRQAEMRVNTALLGVMGEASPGSKPLSPRARALFDGLRPAGRGGELPLVAVLDLDLLIDAAIQGGGLARRASELPQFPAVTRDLAVVVDSGVLWRDIAEAIHAVPLEHLRRFDYIQGSVFEGGPGKPVPAGKKSVAVTLEFRAKERTLTGEEADAWRGSVKDELARRLGASFRE